MHFKKFSLLLLISLALCSCKKNLKNVITKEWKVFFISKKGNHIAISKNDKIAFSKINNQLNLSISIKNLGIKTNGKWLLKKDSIKFFLNPPVDTFKIDSIVQYYDEEHKYKDGKFTLLQSINSFTHPIKVLAFKVISYDENSIELFNKVKVSSS